MKCFSAQDQIILSGDRITLLYSENVLGFELKRNRFSLCLSTN